MLRIFAFELKVRELFLFNLSRSYKGIKFVSILLLQYQVNATYTTTLQDNGFMTEPS